MNDKKIQVNRNKVVVQKLTEHGFNRNSAHKILNYMFYSRINPLEAIDRLREYRNRIGYKHAKKHSPRPKYRCHTQLEILKMIVWLNSDKGQSIYNQLQSDTY